MSDDDDNNLHIIYNHIYIALQSSQRRLIKLRKALAYMNEYESSSMKLFDLPLCLFLVRQLFYKNFKFF